MIPATEHIIFMGGAEAEVAAMAALGGTSAYALLHDSFKDNPNYIENFRDGKLVSITVKLPDYSAVLGMEGITMTSPMMVAAFMEGMGL